MAYTMQKSAESTHTQAKTKIQVSYTLRTLLMLVVGVMGMVLPCLSLIHIFMRLMRLSRNMLDCALYENGVLPLHLSEGDMGAFCRDLARRLDIVGRKAQLDIQWVIPDEPIVCVFDEEKVERMVLNLISNAIRSGRGAPIVVELSERDSQVVITVTDHGGGIASETMSTAMNKHALAPADQTSTAGGAGFGLALLRGFAARHGGTFIMSSNADGTSARISLPKNLDKERMAFNAVRPDYAGGFAVSYTHLDVYKRQVIKR